MSYAIIKTSIPDVLILEPQVHESETGYFFESFSQRNFKEATGLDVRFVQDNHSCSEINVLRGLHYQIQNPQGKLVRVIKGAVFDVSVDLRRSSPNFGKWVGIELSESNRRQLWIPPGFAHGFLVTSESAEFLYKTTDFWYPEHERSLLWCDPTVGVQWPVSAEPKLAKKDAAGKVFAEADYFD
jgi:dTDP-4-dehydrorhamnose 3,5-epimerase